MAVSKLNNWVSTATVSGNTLTLPAVGTGALRLIVVFVTSEATDPVATGISIGGQAGEQISGSPIAAGSSTTQQTVSGWIIKEAAIAARSNDTITVTFTTQPATVSILAAVFAGVDQTTPIVEYQEDSINAATPNPLTGADLTISSADNYAISVSGCGNATTATWTGLTEQDEQASINATAGSSVADLDPSSTGALACRCTWANQNRAAQMSIQLGAGSLITYEISGITKDKSGSPLGSCECYLVKIDAGANSAAFVDYVVSNSSTGAYTFSGITDNDSEYMVIAWKDDAPHVMDATDYILTPIEE
jgi:hypothetical protein